MKEILEYLFSGKTLSREQAGECLLAVGKGLHTEVEFASLLTVFKMRPVTSEELGGFRNAMNELSLRTDLSAYNPIDVVGTGGDGKNTFNISTLACFSGSSDLLEKLGYKFSNDPAKLKKDLEKGNFCFMHAPLFHPAMKHIAPVRRALKVQTFFNILGPMINPASPKYQLLGVNNPENFELYKNVYKTIDVNYAIIHGTDGYDEVSLTADTRIATAHDDYLLSPSGFGMTKIQPEKLFGGNTVEEASKIFVNILEGKGTSEQNNVVVANAALGLQLVFPEKSLADCVAMAAESLKSGKALEKLRKVTK